MERSQSQEPLAACSPHSKFSSLCVGPVCNKGAPGERFSREPSPGSLDSPESEALISRVLEYFQHTGVGCSRSHGLFLNDVGLSNAQRKKVGSGKDQDITHRNKMPAMSMQSTTCLMNSGCRGNDHLWGQHGPFAIRSGNQRCTKSGSSDASAQTSWIFYPGSGRLRSVIPYSCFLWIDWCGMPKLQESAACRQGAREAQLRSAIGPRSGLTNRESILVNGASGLLL